MYCKHRYLRHHELCHRRNLTFTEIQKAENNILVCLEESSFINEMTSMSNRNTVRKNSNIASLNPVVVYEMMRSKGGLCSRTTRCFIILASGHHVTTLIIRFLYDIIGHIGIQKVLAANRKRHLIVKRHSAVKSS